MIKPRYLVGFTGHRSGYDETLIRPPLKKIISDLNARVSSLGGQVELYASVAEGSDTLCVEIARELGMPVHLLLPLEEVEFAKDFSSPESWQRSRAQIKTARQRPGRDSVHLVSGEHTRPECYFNQGMQMLEAVDVLVALWDGQPARGKGGTKQIMDQAKAIGTPVVQIASATGDITGKEGLKDCFDPDETITELNEVARHSQVPCAKTMTDPDSLQECLDHIAVSEADRFRPSLVCIILLHGFAALLATIVTFKIADGHPWDKSKWLITAAELILVSGAWWMGWHLHRKHTQERWIRCRFACEVVRGLRSSVPVINPLHPAIARHEPGWRRFALSVGLFVMEHSTTSNPETVRDDYIEVRLSSTHKDGQIRHYQKMQPAALRWWEFTGQVGRWSATLAPFFVLLSLINKLSNYFTSGHAWHLDENPLTWPLVIFLPIALPLLAGIASSLRQALDAGRRKDRYPQMTARLTEIKAALPGLETASTIQAAITRSEEILLDELIEWQLTVKNTGAH